MAKRVETLVENPFNPEKKDVHAGKVFVFSHGVLKAVGAVSSDSRGFDDAKDHFFLCLWDLDNDASIWIALQSEGEFEVSYASKRMHEGSDPNWMSQDKTSHYRNGAIYRLGSPGNPVSFSQKQKRYVTRSEVETIRSRISQEAIEKILQ